MAGGFAGGITEVLSGKKNLAKGIKVEKEENSVKIDGKTYKVIRLGQVCLENKSLKKIIIPSGITEIGENAFKGGNKLKTIVINGNLKSVEKNAFAEINPKAVFNIKGSKKNYNKMVKLIKKSGVPKTVKFKNVK